MKKRFALLGAGRIGALHADNIADHPEAELAIVADVQLDVARAVAEKHGARHTSDNAAAINDPEVDVVLIASSTDTHVDLITLTAQAEKPALCEKPVDLNLGRVDECLAVVDKHRELLQIGFNRRFDPSFAALHERLGAGEIGKLEVVKITSRDPGPPPLEYIKVSGGLFRDMMIHDFDTARWLLGDEPVSLHATASCLVDPAIGEAGDVDTAVVTMKTAGGVICNIECSRRAAYGYDQRIEVLGEKGMLRADNRVASTVSCWNADAVAYDKPPFFFIERYAESYKRELDHFLDAVAERSRVSVTGRDGRAALVLAEAALESVSSGRTVEVHM